MIRIYETRVKEEIDRSRFSFEIYECMGYDSDFDTWGVHGVSVLLDGNEIGVIPWVRLEDIENMSDDELEDILYEYKIFNA